MTEASYYLPFADAALPQTRVEWAIAEAQVSAAGMARAQAAAMAAVQRTVSEARDHPEVFVSDAGAADAVEFAERAVVAELAVQLSVGESVIRGWVHQVEVLRRRTPRTWEWFSDGALSAANARTVAELVADLPEAVWVEFDTAAVEHRGLAPARFRARLRAVAARLDSARLTERHERAARDRRVWVEHTHDGMAWLMALLPAADAHRAYTALDRAAATITAAPGETRTIAQARADVLTDLLAGPLDTSRPGGTSRPRRVGVDVAVLVPVMTLLGHSDEPATLDGMHPIDADTARRLAGHATSFTRILTHPITGTVLTVDRGTYRVPADLKRWVRAIHPTCVFPGCGRRTRDCDLDHTTAYAHGGTTSAGNLAPLCRHHHRLKHHTRWKARQHRTRHGTPTIRWTTPTGTPIPEHPPF